MGVCIFVISCVSCGGCFSYIGYFLLFPWLLLLGSSRDDSCLPVCLSCFSFSLSIFVEYVCVLGCGGILYGDHGSFSSPNYPGTYPNGTNCEWVIMAPRGRVVTVTFAQISIDDPGDCQNNFLKLYDGPDTSSLPVGPYCGAVCNPRKQTSFNEPFSDSTCQRASLASVQFTLMTTQLSWWNLIPLTSINII